MVLEDGTNLKASDHLTITTEPTRFSVRSIGYQVSLAHPRVLATYKPVDVITSYDEPGSSRPDLHSLLPDLAIGWAPVGRLDAMASGLLLISESGELTQRLTHPKRAVERVYFAGCIGDVDKTALEQLRAGELVLRDGHRPTISALEQVEAPPSAAPAAPEGLSWWRISLAEGKYHEVRRSLAACSLRVEALFRSSYGPVTLETLGLSEPGDHALVTGELYDQLCSSVSWQPPLVLRLKPLDPDLAPPA